MGCEDDRRVGLNHRRVHFPLLAAGSFIEKEQEFKDTFLRHMKMNDLENILKQLHEKFPERDLQQPHSSEYVSDILKLASQKTGNSFPNKLLENRLEEDLFFRSGFDTELYRHLRYLPAN